MSVIKLTLPIGEIPVNGKQVTFVAPCPCSETEALQIDGEQYTVVDSLCKCITGSGGRWTTGATVCVTLDVDNKRAFLQNATGGAMIATGSYVGTGTYGADNPNTLTLDFVPKVIWVGKGGFLNFASHPTSGASMLNTQMLITCTEIADSVPVRATSGGTLYDGTIYFSINGTTVSWYGSYSSMESAEFNEAGCKSVQLNELGETYHYFAIG